MKRLLLILCGLLVAWYASLALISALTSDESKLTQLLETMESGYNRGRVRDAIGALAEDWSHAGQSYTKRDLHAGLVGEFFQGRHPETKQLMRRVALDWESLVIEVGEGSAQVEVEALFERLQPEGWEPRWSARLELELVDGDRGWELQRSSHQDLSGTQLSR